MVGIRVKNAHFVISQLVNRIGYLVVYGIFDFILPIKTDQLILPWRNGPFAGYDLPDEAGYNYIQAQLWVYPLATKVWEQRNVPAGKPRGREAAFHTPSCKMMIIGGSEPANDQLYLYTP